MRQRHEPTLHHFPQVSGSGRAASNGLAHIAAPASFVRFEHEEIEQAIPQRFQKQVTRHASRPGVTVGTERLDYSGLNELANRVAHDILGRVGTSSSPVATLMDLTPTACAAALGVLKAGKVWVPLDPAHPPGRLAYMLKDAGVDLILTDSQHLELGEGLSRMSEFLVDLDDLPERLSAENPTVDVSPDDLAYIIYTSGSTGRPKGVVQNHRNALHSTYLHTNTLCISPDDRLSCVSSFSHLAGVSALFRSLLNGASLFPFPVIGPGPSRMATWLIDNDITIYNSVPTVFRHFVAGLEGPEEFPHLRVIHLGGEMVSRRDVDLYREHFSSNCTLLVNLGSTEVSIYRQFLVDHKTKIGGSVVPVGYAIEDKEVRLLDEQGREVVEGQAGEIVIKSPYLALGYRSNPELTRRSFRGSPHDQDRLFHTGDMGRMLPDGCLVHVGRKDSQVKIRGERVEVNEIEAVMVEHSAVKECAVAAFPWNVYETRLVGYVVPMGDYVPTPGELRQHLASTLPAYMVPACFVTLDALPLTPGGKVDRTALPTPTPEDRERAGMYAAPRNPTEAVIAEIWAAVLGVDRVGIEESFFDLGGHSLLATQIISRVREACEVELPVRDLFESSTVARLAARVAGERRQVAGSGPALLRLVGRRGPQPLSFAQRRFWFLSQLAHDGAEYHIAPAWRIEGPLDVSALQQALEAIVARHESLRTRFPSPGGKPVQQIAAPGKVSLPITDLSALPTEARETALSDTLTKEVQRPFTLAHDLPIRLRLFRLGVREHVILLVVHHVAADGWSMGVIFRELGLLYAARVRGEDTTLAKLPIQYADFAQWQRACLSNDVLERQLSYWRLQLAGAPAVLQLPADHPRPPVRRYRGERQTQLLPPALGDAVAQVSRDASVTTFTTLLATFQLLLSRYTTLDDIVVGSPVAGRTHRELEPLVGCFVNTLVLRTSLAGDPTFRELLRRVQGVVLGALAHQDVPFEKLVEELQPARDLGRSPLFQVMFVGQTPRPNELELEGLEVRAIPVNCGVSPFDLTLSVRHAADGLTVTADYDSTLFASATMKRLLAHFETLLQHLVTDPTQRLSGFSLLSDGERIELLNEGAGPLVEYPHDHCVHELFESQAERRPTSLAVSDETTSLTYRVLEIRANQLAHHLLTLGVGPGVLVGICLERSVEQLVALLAVLKAGGAYVPLDPAFPSARLAFMLADATPAVLVTDVRQLARLPSTPAAAVCLDRDWPRVRKAGSERPPCAAGPDDLAYVIYTSGSTGQPKGVEITHRAVVNFLASMQREPGLNEADVLLSATTLSFDIAVLELLLPLITGARTVLVRDEVAADGHRLAQTIAQSAPTVMQATPATWRLLLSAGWEGDGRLKILCGGEQLPRDLADQLLARGASVWNLYGPTETTVWSAAKRVAAGQGPVPIGPPIANTQFHVLDPRLEPVPAGVPGELYIGGEGLARGYRRRPELTLERFVPHPFAAAGRLYRTGDRVRRRADGDLEFLGRLDHQVKVRGFRIELGEIESALALHSGVSQSVVVSREDSPGDQRLVAYVVPMSDHPLDPAELRSHLAASLPAYMLPSSIITLEALPLTPNGKVDRTALPAPAWEDKERAVVYVAPRTQTEAVVAEVWAAVLGIGRVGVTESFFDLGGHSLLATQVISRVREACEVEIPLRYLFESPTVAEFADVVDGAVRSEVALSPPPLVPISGLHERVVSFAQQRFWFLDQLGPDRAVYHIPKALRLQGVLNLEALQDSLDLILHQHECLRTCFRAERGVPVPVVSETSDLPLKYVEVHGDSQSERDHALQSLLQEDAQQPFDLSRDLMLRVTLAKVGPEDHVLLFVAHHVASDAWSMEILLRELTEHYRASCSGQVATPAENEVRYSDFAHWQRAYVQGDVFARQLTYWRRQLAAAPPVLELPVDHARPAVESHRGGRETIALSSDLTESLQLVARNARVTMFTTLLAAFQLLLFRYTAQDDVVVGSPVAGRTHRALEPLVGCFVNTLVLRTSLAGNPTFRELLERVQEVVLGGLSHQDVPFEQLVGALQPERTMSRSPLFQVMFVLQHESEVVELPELTVTTVTVERQTSMFDLTLFMRNTAAGLGGTFQYNSDLFEPATIRQMSGHFRDMLERVVIDPSQRLSNLGVSSARMTGERHGDGQGKDVA